MILVTGGAGYVGSHTCVALLEAGEEVVVLDNFSNSKPASLERVERICGRRLHVVEGDIRDQTLIEKTLTRFACGAVLHFAGLKAVQQSVEQPLQYYDHNVIGSHRLLSGMKNCGVRQIVFSSSATVYGKPVALPIAENHPLLPVNPYGRTKLIIEDMLRDQCASDPSWGVAILRYFNPAGAHASGLIGEDPNGTPNNLVPFVAQVAIGRRERLQVWGSDYDTPDGTGVRDYVHVMDLANGHVAALQQLQKQNYFAVNLGTGRGNSVLEVVRAFEQASGKSIPFDLKARRAGDVDACYAATSYAWDLMGWKSTRSLADICLDHWRWQSTNPNGFA